MTHRKHLYLMVGLAALAAVVLFTGTVSGGGLLFLFVGACITMVVLLIVYLMVGNSDAPHRGGEHNRPEDFAGRHR